MQKSSEFMNKFYTQLKSGPHACSSDLFVQIIIVQVLGTIEIDYTPQDTD